MDLRYCILLFVVIFHVKHPSWAFPPQYSPDLETSLRNELFENYSVLQRPSKKVDVTVSLTLLTINDLNIKDQTLSISGYLTLDWDDSRLSWYDTSTTTQDYSNIFFLFSTETYVWRPAIIIENSVDQISVISDNQIPMRLTSRGKVSWSPAGIYKVSCESDTTYYPLDYQSCTIKVSTWGYTQTEIQLRYDVFTPVELGFYTENGEWTLISAVGTTTQERSRGGQTFSSLTFQIDLQRRPIFHVLNTLFPVALMAFLIPMAFKLPPDSGEKIGFTLTVLLAYAVYLTLISDNIPSTSVTVCYLSVYLALTLMYGTVSVVLAIVVLIVHHQPEEEKIPPWLRKFTTCFLMRLLCQSRDSTCKRGHEAVTPAADDIIVVKASKTAAIEKPAIPNTALYRADDEVELKWRTVSVLLDKFFFILVMSLVGLTTLIVFSVIIAHFDKTN